MSNFCSPMYFTSITIGKDKSIEHDLNRNDDRLLPYFFKEFNDFFKTAEARNRARRHGTAR